MSDRSFRLALAAILVFALGIRAAAAIDANSIPLASDSWDFDRHAVSIAEGDGYAEAQEIAGGGEPSAFRPPALPFLLGGLYAVTGSGEESDRWLRARLLQAVLGTIAVGLTGLIALRIWGRRPALLAAGLAALYPGLILAGTAPLSEPLFTVLILAGVLLLLRYRLGDERRRWLIAAGACAGLAALTRGNGIAVVLLFAFGAWVLRPRLSLRSLAGPALVAATAVLTIVPWTIRNAGELEAFVPVTTQTGLALGGQYNDVAERYDWRWIIPSDVPAYRRYYAGEPLGEVELSRRLSDEALDYIADHPTAPVSAAFHNGLRLLSLSDPVALERSSAEVIGQPPGLAEANVYAFWLLAALAIAGALTALARAVPAFVWAIVPLLLASVVFTAGNARYRSPVEPILILFAVATVETALVRAAGARAARSRRTG